MVRGTTKYVLRMEVIKELLLGTPSEKVKTHSFNKLFAVNKPVRGAWLEDHERSETEDQVGAGDCGAILEKSISPSIGNLCALL